MVSVVLSTTIFLSSCNQTSKVGASIAVQEQNKTIKEIIAEAKEQERKVAQLPEQPKECGQRTQVIPEAGESYARLSTRLFLGLRQSNDIRVACYNFNEKIREDRKQAYASGS